MMPYIAEFLGTFILVLLGNGVVANVVLNKSGMKDAGAVQITIAWGLAVLLPVFIFGKASGAHINPAVSIAMAIDGSLAVGMLFGYIAAQMLGAMTGALFVYLMFKNQFDATEDQGAIKGSFCTAPAVRDIPRNIFNEAVATFILVFAIKGVGQSGAAAGVDSLFVFAIIVSLGMSLGGLTGYALNPARDIGPRIMHQLLPLKGKGSSDWSYAIVPIVGPIIGAVSAVLLFGILPW